MVMGPHADGIESSSYSDHFCVFFLNTYNSFTLQAKLMIMISKDSLLCVLSNDTMDIHWCCLTSEILLKLRRY